jgi:hypothetical protein
VSLDAYQEFWIAWWTALQPKWRHVEIWPFPQASSTSSSWDDILIGGKDGFFIVIMALAWWSIERTKGNGGPTELENAISDVTWVLSNLASVLVARCSPSRLPPPSDRPSTRSHKIGPPNKRPRLARS